MSEPTVIYAGDTLKWSKSLSDYKASDGWTLIYYLHGLSDITINATADGDNFKVEVSKDTTKNYTAGNYWLFGYVSKGSERYQVAKDHLEIKPDFATLTGTYDGRSHTKKVLDAIEAVLEDRASIDQMGISIAGRTLSNTPIDDLLRLRNQYRAEYRSELDAENRDKGKGTKRKILLKL